ncbi:MAG: hypothetical protein KBD44_00840 [Candidatus Pacebacteria bacterium]|nr:hypothetical protein [Candidatus Paceibacterota bacterium]
MKQADEDRMQTLITTQPTTTLRGQTRAFRMAEGIHQFFFGQSQLRTGTTLTRAETIHEIVKARRCSCHGTCPGCRHIIKDVLGD